ncbi:MAG: pyridoxal phosphate-dependent class II aminotransferase [Peptostreptococcaceae bacterium]|nr:pyridoxal phosphate-dependent class II aminotransferase [Peptostreptococcaceae bacterium]
MGQFGHGADVLQMMERYGVKELVDHSSNVNIFTPNKLEELLREIGPKDLDHYPDINYSHLREKLSRRYAIEPERIIVGNGSTELIFLLTRLPELRRIGIIHPTFGEYGRATKISGKELIPFCYDSEFQLDLSKIDLQAVDALFVCNPNNPSGNINDLEELMEKAQAQGVLLIVDETFMDFAVDQSRSLLPYVTKYDNLFVLKAITKFYSMTGVRLGYGFCSKKWIDRLWAIKEPWTVNAFAEHLVDVVFDEEFERRSVEFYHQEILWMGEELQKIPGLKVYPTQSNYFLLRLPDEISSSDLKERMIVRYGILIRDCSNHDGLNGPHIRVNIKERTYNQMLIEALQKEITIE